MSEAASQKTLKGRPRYSGIIGAIAVIAASAGGLEPLRRIKALPLPRAASVFVVVRIGCIRR
jgi:hypothetical protein